MKKTISLVMVLALGLTTEVANADFTFGTPTNLGPTVNSSGHDANQSISADGLEMYFSSGRPGGYGIWDIWVTTRPTINDPWGTPVNLGSTVNSGSDDPTSSISADGLTLYFTSNRPGGFGEYDVWVTTRATKEDPWGEPANLGSTVNSSYYDVNPSISADGLSLYFTEYTRPRPGGYGGSDIWVTTRTTKQDPWGEPVNLGPTVNSSAMDEGPSISADGRTLFFGSKRPGGFGGHDVWVTTRASVSDPWDSPVNLGPTVNSSASEHNPRISSDGLLLYFCDYGGPRPGGFGGSDLWQVSIVSIVDFNGDGIVNSADMCIMVDHWHTNEPSCDIGPTPLGDGIVDVQDLVVLAEYLFEDINDSTLVAHWALDETEGMIVADSAGDNNGYALGDPFWKPDGGQVDGALQLDGVDDYVITGSVPNPAEGPFSVFAWVKGGAPGQAVLSQMGGARWLCADPSGGNLMTELKGTGRDANELLSQTIITDGNWHRIGLVWDGSNRKLYVDDVAVAEDEQTNLAASENGLYIGAGTAMEPGSFWSGLIDDVRIYNRAVTP